MYVIYDNVEGKYLNIPRQRPLPFRHTDLQGARVYTTVSNLKNSLNSFLQANRWRQGGYATKKEFLENAWIPFDIVEVELKVKE